MSLKVPVLLITYKRPETTRLVLNEIRKIQPLKLYISQNLYANKTDIKKHTETLEIIENIDWNCEVNYLRYQNHLSARDSIYNSISWFFENVEEGIILEDDCLPNESFFKFCEILLSKYKNNKEINMIAGTNYFEDLNDEMNYFYSKHFMVWGWATWKDRWQEFKLEDFSRYYQELQITSLKKYYSRRYIHYMNKRWKKSSRFEIDTWDYQWVHHCLLKETFSIVPPRNLISNIGIDGTNTRFKTPSHFRELHELDKIQNFKNEYIKQNIKYDNKITKYILNTPTKLLFNRIKSIIKLHD